MSEGASRSVRAARHRTLTTDAVYAEKGKEYP
jgi:hypothetical protein